MSRQIFAKFKKFAGKNIREASGVAQLGPDRFIIVDDRKNMFFQAVLQDDDQLTATALKPDESVSFSLLDMEGVAKKPDDSWVYVITSYSDSPKKSRQRLARFQIKEDNSIGNMEKVENAKGLKESIQNSLRNRFEFLPRKYPFNIEGFSWAADGQELLIGLRSPIIRGQAVIVRTKGLDHAFSRDKLTFPEKEITSLDLKNRGIRAMAHIPDLEGYLLISGKGEEVIEKVKGEGDKDGYLLWFWDGKGSVKEILRFPKATGKKKDTIQPEGLCAVTSRNGKTASVLIVSDDGDLGDNAQGKYWLLSPTDYGILKSKCCPSDGLNA